MRNISAGAVIAGVFSGGGTVPRYDRYFIPADPGSFLRKPCPPCTDSSTKKKRGMGMEFQHELIIPNEGLPFKLFLFEGRNGNYVREKHWHTSIEIFTVMEGSLSFYIDEVEYPLKAGEFLIINSNEVHSIRHRFVMRRSYFRSH